MRGLHIVLLETLQFARLTLERPLAGRFDARA